MAATSLAAYHSLDLSELEKMVLVVIEGAGADGCISDDVRAAYPSLSYSSVTARFASLESKGLILRAGDTMPGESGRQQKVMRHSKYFSITPMVKIKRKPPGFLAGMMYATRVMMKASDLNDAKRAMIGELKKASTR